MTKIERRMGIELRASGRKLEGYAAVFNTKARIADFTEIIMPGAFRRSLNSGRDIVALVDHDPTRLLARTRTGTLKLSEDSRGLAFEIQVPDTQAGRDVLVLGDRKDLGGMSFGFTVEKDGERWQGTRRELRALSLHEISVVSAWLAYDGTIVQARCKVPVRLAMALRYLETV
ncbi:MAG TPA: HK97 family phage prohead protease [Syntrophobacter fumaroxidans]|nr:HK97 family phage prohead protease [Syntrophobacter fumaroxidans]